MFLILIPSQWAIMFDTTLMSYITPVAQCDLDLSLNDKGTINAIAPFGKCKFSIGRISDM